LGKVLPAAAPLYIIWYRLRSLSASPWRRSQRYGIACTYGISAQALL